MFTWTKNADYRESYTKEKTSKIKYIKNHKKHFEVLLQSSKQRKDHEWKMKKKKKEKKKGSPKFSCYT